MQDFTYINKELGTDYNSNKEIDWYAVSTNFKLSESFIEKFKDKVDWFAISMYQNLSEPFIEKHQDKVDWNNISMFQKLSEEFIEKHKDKVDWYYISYYQKLSEPFIERHQDKVDWYNVAKYQKLSEEFIGKYKYKVDWKSISKFHRLSESFIETNVNPYYYKDILIYQKLSDDFINKYELSINKDKLWQYKDTEFKKQELIKTGKYECYEDYFIAYKAIRNDRYSFFNLQYQYLPGETYESTCDCTNSEDSFGLNVGTHDFAKNYLGTKFGMVIKCKVFYEDIGRIVHDGEKIRCFKITVLE